MRGKEEERQAFRRMTLLRLGVDPEQTRHFVGQVGAMGMEGALLRLPSTTLPQAELFDPATGDLYFMMDFSELDGDDLLQ